MFLDALEKEIARCRHLARIYRVWSYHTENCILVGVFIYGFVYLAPQKEHIRK